MRVWPRRFGEGGGESEKYKDKLRFVHIKDCNSEVLEEARNALGLLQRRTENKVCHRDWKGNEYRFPRSLTLIKNSGYSGWSVIEKDVKLGRTEIPPKDRVGGVCGGIGRGDGAV